MITTSHCPASSRYNSGDTLPPDLDPKTHRIIATHFYGVEPGTQANDRQSALVGPIAAGIVADLAFQRDVERLHRLGPRPQYELLRAELDPNVVQALSGDRFPEAPIHEVGR